jgi:ATP phosphoribosyltransferase regulatory subunit
MTSRDKNYALLPAGFADILPPDAQVEADTIHSLMSHFSSFGFERVKPPLVEFEDSLFAPGPGAALIDDTFRLMDPISHKMMGVRSDITAQIARIAATRLGLEERPLRLSYANDVLRTKASQQRTLRQFCQVGCEIIGDESLDADVESCVVGLVGLKGLGIANLTIDIAMPSMVRDVLAAGKLAPELQRAISTALDQRDLEALKSIKNPAAKILAQMIGASGPAAQALETLKNVKQIKAHVRALKDVYEGLKSAIDSLGFKDVAITIDPLENRLLDYHNGVAFTYYAQGVRGEIGRGGRYMIQSNGHSDHATGFTLYMDTVRQAMGPYQGRDIVCVSASEPWQVLQDLRAQGWIVLRMKNEKTIPKRATHVYKGGKVVKR